jgi:biotin carboxylase
MPHVAPEHSTGDAALRYDFVMERLLLLVTTRSYRAGAFLDAARRLGIPVVVGTDRPQALEGLNPDGHLTLDFGDPDRASRDILAYAARRPIGAVIAADDDGVSLAAAAAEALSLPHHPPRGVEASRNKLATRMRLEQAGLPVPPFASVSTSDPALPLADAILSSPPRSIGAAHLPDDLRYPCVLKPLDLAASRGVIRADDPAEFVAAFDRVAAILGAESSHAGGDTAPRLLIEGYLEGREIAVEGLMSGGALHVLAIFDKPDPLVGPYFEETIYVTPSRHDPAVLDDAVESTRRATLALGLAHGPIHAELRLTPDGPRVLEIAPRSIGGLCSRALRFGSGVSLEEVILGHAYGLDAEPPPRERRAAGVMMIPVPAAGTLRSIDGRESARSIPGIEDVRITVPIGDTLVPWPEGSRYLGFIFARADTPDRVEESLREAHRRLRFEVEPRAVAASV